MSDRPKTVVDYINVVSGEEHIHLVAELLFKTNRKLAIALLDELQLQELMDRGKDEAVRGTVGL